MQAVYFHVFHAYLEWHNSAHPMENTDDYVG